MISSNICVTYGVLFLTAENHSIIYKNGKLVLFRFLGLKFSFHLTQNSRISDKFCLFLILFSKKSFNFCLIWIFHQ